MRVRFTRNLETLLNPPDIDGCTEEAAMLELKKGQDILTETWSYGLLP